MGSKSHTKKTRQRTKKAISSKIKQKSRRFQNPKQIRDEKLRERFDKSKTWTENLRNTDLKEMYKDALPTEDQIAKVRNVPKVNEDEARICDALVKKHGEEDYDAMFRDHKVNVWQWTAKVCEKKVSAWREGKTRSEAAELLSGHGIDQRKQMYGHAKKRNVFGH